MSTIGKFRETESGLVVAWTWSGGFVMEDEIVLQLTHGCIYL